MSAVTFSAGPARPVRVLHSASATTGTARPKLRLTARGRAVITTLVAAPLVVAAIVLTLGDGGAVATSTAGDDSFTYVSVATGESLWDLAELVAPNADPREFIADIVRLNALDSATVHPGERLAIPHEYDR